MHYQIEATGRRVRLETMCSYCAAVTVGAWVYVARGYGVVAGDRVTLSVCDTDDCVTRAEDNDTSILDN